MATFNKFNIFVENLAEKVHNLSAESLKVALFASGWNGTAINSF